MPRQLTKPRVEARLPFAQVAEAETILMKLADFIYGHTALKPMSKTLFFLSRCLLVVEFSKSASAGTLARDYRQICQGLNGCAPHDDYEFSEVAAQCGEHLDHVLKALRRVRQVTRQSDSLGLVFNTLLRGKYEGGEGLGTYLTPEEVVEPMVEMLLASAEPALVAKLLEPRPKYLYGDICGGTGRFVYALTRRLRESARRRRASAANAARLYDQSSFAVDCGKLNFIFDGFRPTFHRVDDSLTNDEISSLRGKFALLATNPPFGTGKYRWNLWLKEALPHELLAAIGLKGWDDAVDPSELFFFRNLDLLAPGGGLAIVMPDGVIQSERFRQALDVYERLRCPIHIEAIVSLPVATFALGGTVAKTSFVIVRNGEPKLPRPLYVASAEHIGFLKRGNKRVADPHGNDLAEIAQDFRRDAPRIGTRVGHWRDFERLAPSRLFARHAASAVHHKKLGTLAVAVRQTVPIAAEHKELFHISVLDVDETGLIDVVAAARNRPASPALVCSPGNVIVSCINPRIWRVAVIPDIPGVWTCSTEFLVLRTKAGVIPWELAAAMQHATVRRTVQAMAGGTSSSRQRVPKGLLLDVDVPVLHHANGALTEHAATRKQFYLARLEESRAYARLRDGANEFYLR
jgi:hypothetical protein